MKCFIALIKFVWSENISEVRSWKMFNAHTR